MLAGTYPTVRHKPSTADTTGTPPEHPQMLTRSAGNLGGLFLESKGGSIMESTDALNRHDLPKFMSAWSDDGVFVYPGEIPESGTFEGKGAVEGWVRRFFEQFPEIRFDLQDMCIRNIFDLSGTNVAAVHWNVQLTNRAGRVGHNSGVTVVSIRRGKVCFVKDFIFDLGDNFKRNWGAA